MADPALTPSLLAELLAVNRSVLAEIRGLRGDIRMAATKKALPHGDECYVRLFQAIEDAITQTATMELEAKAVIEHGECDFELSEALKACDVDTTDKLGLLFRSVRDRDINGWRAVRDGDGWRLERT